MSLLKLILALSFLNLLATVVDSTTGHSDSAGPTCSPFRGSTGSDFTTDRDDGSCGDEDHINTMSSDSPRYSKDELKERLTSMQYWVTQEHGTERANSGEYVNLKDDGNYYCVVCGALLFSSKSKYNSGSGWPSFSEIAEQSTVETSIDSSQGMVRTEVKCSNCKAHLGHMFEDGPQPTGLRYCVNSASMKFESAKKP